MRSLIQFILKYQNFILFLILELSSILLLVNNNVYHNAKLHSLSLSVMGRVYEKQNEINNYFSLRYTNEELAKENAILKEMLIKGHATSPSAWLSIQDSLADRNLTIIPAKVVNASVSRQHNLLTINVGTADSVGVDMAVIGPLGAVGVIKSVSRHYATVLPLINAQYRVSAKLYNNDYFGTLLWDTGDYRLASLNGVEQHVSLALEDTVVTSGYGAVFPEGIMIGTIDCIEAGEEGVFHDLRIMLSTDFKRLSYVFVIKNKVRSERLAVEQESSN